MGVVVHINRAHHWVVVMYLICPMVLSDVEADMSPLAHCNLWYLHSRAGGCGRLIMLIICDTHTSSPLWSTVLNFKAQIVPAL